MNVAKLREIVAAIRYKPGVELSVTEQPSLGGYGFPEVTLHVRQTVPDRDTGLPFPLHYWTGLPEFAYNRSGVTEADVLAAVRRVLILWETHELDEVFHYRGARIYDPHAPYSHPADRG
jgi:hypothetical protein